MKVIKHLLMLSSLSAACLSGCRTKTPSHKSQDYTVVPLYMAGSQIPSHSQEKYLSNAMVKMYSIGRMVDPGSGVMREAGAMYRIESEPQWNLIPQYDANPESLARARLQEQYADSMTGQVNRAFAESRELKHSLDAIQQDIAAIHHNYNKISGESEQLKQELKKQKDNSLNLLEGMKKIQQYIEILEQRIADRNTMDLGDRP
ncbi:MAG: hypothetical protein JXR78_04655 [Victivallales bacterium]|nr:hypothetical protein [Victivallales bacterium]